MMSIVTVVYSEEMLLWELQAKSIKKFADLTKLDKVVIVINERDDHILENYVDSIVKFYFSDFIEKIKIVFASHYIESKDEILGWRSQQLIKIKASLECDSDYILILDAKNHFIKPFSIFSFMDENAGLIYSHHEGRGAMDKFLIPSLGAFGVVDEGIENILPCTTPYFIRREIIINMVLELQEIQNCSFEEYFLKKNRMCTEFFLIYAFLLKNNFLDRYFKISKELQCVTLFGIWPDTKEKVDWAFSRVSDPSTVCFGIHRLRFKNMSSDIQCRIVKVLTDSGLMDSDDEADLFINKLKFLSIK